jgi:hypothetical protein
MVTERTIINSLIIGASFIVVPFVVSSSLTVNNTPALVLGCMSGALASFFFFKDRLAIMPLLATAFGGTLTFLPLPLTWSHVTCILLILYYITGYVIIRQKKIKVGRPRFFWPILIVTLIVFYHNHSLGVRIAGGGEEGGKPALLIFLVVLAYFCGINIKNPSVELLSNVPRYYVIVTACSSVPFLLSTVVPGLAPYLYIVTDTVNVDAYMDTKAGLSNGFDSGGISRVAIFGPLAVTFQLYLLCYYPIGTWFRPQRLWVLLLSIICASLAVASGFRSVLFGYMAITMTATWCYYSWRSIFLPIGVCVAVVVLFIAAHNNLVPVHENKLPMIAQRTLSFLPGDWDQQALESAAASNKFRQSIIDVYVREYMKKSPWFGNGFSINRVEFEGLSNGLANGTMGKDNDYLQAKVFIEGKIFHTGWVSLYDTVGIIGSLALLALCWTEIATLSRRTFGPKIDRRSSLYPVYIWMLSNIIAMFFCFFAVFGDFAGLFMNMCINALFISHLCDVSDISDVPVVLSDRKSSFELGRSSEARYGYQSRY